ncbi:MAG: hypothetical protein ABIA66_04455 [Candidatus Omnitrophota bacterium]
MGKPEVKFYVFFLFFFLVGITTFSIFKYASGLREKYGLLGDLNKIKGEVGILNIQKQNLLQTIEKAKELQQELTRENLGLADSLKLSKEELSKFKEDFVRLNSAIEELNSQNSLLKSENTALREDTDGLTTQVAELFQENEELKERLNSIAELRKAIIELKRASRKRGLVKKKKPKMDIVSEGNQGFIVKGGYSTYSGKVKIEVIPVEANNQ